MKQLQHLLNKVNKVTAYHRHGNKIPKSALDELSNAQIEYEKSFPVDKPVKVNFAEEMYKAIKFTLDYDKREIRENDDYEVSFLYPANNLSYQKLLKAVKMYEDSKISA